MKRYHWAWIGILIVCVATPLQAQTFCTAGAITIPAAGTSGVASPYPSTLNVAGAATPATITLTIRGFAHTFPDDVDMLLVGPTGQKMIVQSDAGSGYDVGALTYTLSDAGETALPDATTIFPRVYRSASYGGVDAFAVPAPAGPYNEAAPAGSATLRSSFGGINPNGTWSLYVVDDTSGDTGAITQGWCLNLTSSASAASPMRISELRVRGPSGANDEFVELMNISDQAQTVASFDGSSGFGVFASDGALRCVIGNGTAIPAYGHFLCANSVGYSLSGYPAGNGSTATADATFTTDIPDNAGIALFAVSNVANATLANRLDAVGSTSEANTLYKEGSGYPALTPFSIDYAFVRDDCGKGGSITALSPCPNAGIPQDSDNNAVDFVFVDSNGTSAGAGQRLGVAGPQNLTSPTTGRTGITSTALDTCVTATGAPNRVRDFTSDPANNSTFGTLDIRRSYTNTTGVPLTRLRFRVTDMTTFPAPSGVADMRTRTSSDISVTVDQPPCGSSSAITVFGTTEEQPPSQPNGGAFNTSFSVPSVTPGTPLANGATINLRFLFGLQQTGLYRIDLMPEALPAGGGPDPNLIGCTDGVSCGEFIFRDGFES